MADVHLLDTVDAIGGFQGGGGGGGGGGGISKMHMDS